MTTDAIDQITRRLNRNTALVSWGLAFIVVFALTLTVSMMWAMYHIGRNAAAIQGIGDQNRTALCSLKRETKIRLHIFAVSSVGIMPESLRVPLEASYRVTYESLSSLDCTGV